MENHALLGLLAAKKKARQDFDDIGHDGAQNFQEYFNGFNDIYETLIVMCPEAALDETEKVAHLARSLLPSGSWLTLTIMVTTDAKTKDD